MLNVVKDWYRRYLSDPQAVILLFIVLGCFTVVLLFGDMLMPVLISVVLAYLLEWFVKFLVQRGSHRLFAVILVWMVFAALLIFMVFGMLPLLSTQIADFIPELTQYWNRWQLYLLSLPQQYPFVPQTQIEILVDDLGTLVNTFAKEMLSSGFLKSVTTGFITLIIYLVLVPLLVFFFLKDKALILEWFGRFLPQQRTVLSQVWSELELQLGNYVRGKVWEIVIVTVVTYLVFVLFGLKYAFLLAVIVGLSVLIPYIGVVIVTVPVAAVAYFQFGMTSEFVWLMVAYLIIQGLDGNVLVPVLFSEVVNLHPVAIIVSVLIFGGLWGFWGVFFAIPLATLVNAILNAWPQTGDVAEQQLAAKS